MNQTPQTMKILKKIAIIIGIIVAIPLVAAIFIQKEYNVVRTININQPKQVVFDYIKMLKNQNQYSKWSNMDPNMKKTYKGTDGTVGFVSAWDSQLDSVGAGEQEIKKIIEGEKIEFELHFIRPFESVEQAFMSTKAVSDATTEVQWGFNGHFAYPMNFALLFLDIETMIGNDLDTGLKKLKANLENPGQPSN